MKLVYENGWIGREQYLKITNTYKYNGILTCEICNQPINNQNDNKKFSIDHITPKSEGGNGNLENLRVAHTKCNNERKTERLPNYYRTVKINKVTTRTLYRGYKYSEAINRFEKNKSICLQGEKIAMYVNGILEMEWENE